MLDLNSMKLWSFLHAFQNSTYRYVYLADVLQALKSCAPSPPSWELVIHNLKQNRFTHESWWESLYEETQAIEIEELRSFDPARHRFVFYGERDFPQAFMNSSNPPLALSYEGSLTPFEGANISVVGSREPHEYSKRWMQKDFYHFLKAQRPPVVSGGARGVDQLAHRMALLLDLPTAVILPSGLSKKYPSLWNSTDEWIQQGVTFVSEMRLSATISKRNFSSRNRLIAFYSSTNLIVEARAKSGTLITAHHALIEGKNLCVVPGHPQLTQFAGSLQLLIQGGQLVRDAFDLSFVFQRQSQDLTDLTL